MRACGRAPLDLYLCPQSLEDAESESAAVRRAAERSGEVFELIS